MTILVLHEESGHSNSPLVQDTELTANAAREAGLDVHTFASDFDLLGTADEALEHLPSFSAPMWGVWLGFIPSPERYRAVYDAAKAHGITLINDPADYQLTSEFDLFYPKLEGITPRSAMITDAAHCRTAVEELGFPVFVKGAVRSARTQGWRACVAENADELYELVVKLLGMEARSRGRVVVRELIRLRHARVTEHDFPLGREFRVLLYCGEVFGHGYYWPGDDPLMNLSIDEEHRVLSLAREAARRVGAPFMTVDVGQCEDGEWIVIETGDPQFAGWSQIPRAAAFTTLRKLVK
jgi:hypothetical protein